VAVAVVDIQVRSSGAVQQLKAVNNESKQLSSSVDQATKSVRNLEAAIQTLGVGIAAARIGQLIQEGVKAFADLDTATRRLKTVGGNVQELSVGLKGLSRSFGNLVSQTELAQASYQALSAGFTDTAGNLAILEAATKAGIGGQVEVSQALEVTTKTLNAYGLSGQYATAVTDSISKAIEYGVVQWSDYTSQLGRVVSLAALAGVGLDEVNAFIAAATKNGATAEVAFTGLSAALSTLVQPTEKSQEAAKQLGVNWNISGLQAKGFSGLLADLATKQANNTEAAAALLGSQEAMRGVFAANAKGGKDFQMILEGLGGAAGKTEADFQAMEGSMANQLTRLSNNFEALKRTVVEEVVPAIFGGIKEINRILETSIQFVEDYADGWRIIAGAAQSAIKPFEGIAKAIGEIDGKIRSVAQNPGLALLLSLAPGGPLAPLIQAPAQLGAAARGRQPKPAAAGSGNKPRLPKVQLPGQQRFIDEGSGRKKGKTDAERAAEAAKKEAERVAEVIRNRLAEGQMIRMKSDIQDKIAAAEAAGDKMLVARLQGQQKEVDLQYKYAKLLAEEKNVKAQEAIIYEGLNALTANQRDTQRELNELQNQSARDQIAAMEQIIGKQYELNDQQKKQKDLVDGISNTVGQGMTSAFDALIQGSQDFGSSLRQIASGVLIDIANQLLQVFVIQKAINAISGLFGPKGGGGLSYAGVSGNALGTSVISGGFNAVPFATTDLGFGSGFGIMGRRAMGGSVTAGQPYLVGERGPELFMPGRSGGIAPTGSFGGGVNVVVNVDASGSQVQGDQNQARALGGAISAAVQAEIVKQQRPGGLLAGTR
jgi:TP901 family phage tail tape measure protein